MHRNTIPTQEELDKAPLLNNWRLIGTSLYGHVTGHPRLGDRPNVRTSVVLDLEIEAGWARTLNTLYRLGRPAEVPLN